MKNLTKDMNVPSTQAPEVPKSPEESLQAMPSVSCEETGSVDTNVPSDVTFTDQCEVLQNQYKALEKYQGQLPKNIPVPGQMPPNAPGVKY